MYGPGFCLLLSKYFNHDSVAMEKALCNDSNPYKTSSNESVQHLFLWRNIFLIFSSPLSFDANWDW